MRSMVVAFCVGVVLAAAPVLAQQPAAPNVDDPNRATTQQPQAQQTAPRTQAVEGAEGIETKQHVLKASELRGMDVKNAAGEDLGNIEDLVIDMNEGRVQYAALSFGGFLGLGDKLFAVPFHAMRVQQGEDADDRHFVLKADKQKLEQARGFSKDAWPDMNNPEWARTIHDFWGVKQQEPRTATRPQTQPQPQQDRVIE